MYNVEPPKVPAGEDDPGATALELWLYQFRRRLRRASSAGKRMTAKGGSFRVEVKWDAEEGGAVSYKTPDEHAVIEFVVAMAPFLRPESSLYVRNVFGNMARLSDTEAMKNWLSEAREHLRKINQTAAPVTVNDRQLMAGDVALELATNVVFNDSVAAAEYAKKLMEDPVLGSMKWFMFHNYCTEAFRLMAAADAFIHDNDFYPRPARTNRCIYCGTSDGPFKNVEHVVPEALGNESSLLPRGYVCDSCPARVAPVEQAFMDMVPMKLLRVFMGTANKQGRLPVARFGPFHIERTSPNSLRLTSYSGPKGMPRETPLPGGSVHFKIEGSSKFDHITVARALFKIALGVIAIEQGRAAALDSRYDAARRFVVEGGTFPNKLVLFRNSVPNPGGRLHWLPLNNGGTAFLADLHGVGFMFNLEPQPPVSPPPEILPHVQMFDLQQPPPA